MEENTLGRTIRAQRKNLKVPQEELALLSGVSERTIRDIEQGKTGVSLSKILAVLDVLGLRLEVKEQ